MENYRTIDFNENVLENILKNNYSDIYDEMIKEDYILEYNSFVEFRELLYKNKIVGFLTLDTFLHSDFLLCLNECYILPEYRGKGIMVNIINELLEDETQRFYIRKPNFNFIKFLLKYGYAFEVAPDIISSYIKFIIKGEETYSNKKIKRLYYKLNSNSKELVYYTAAFHMDYCSIFGVDPLTGIAKEDNTLIFTLPRKCDLKRFNLREKLKNLSVNKIMEIHYDFAINKDKIAKFNNKISSKLNGSNDDVLIIGHGDETLVFENLKPNDAVKIENAVENEIKNGNLNFSSGNIRFEYLLNNPEKINKTVNLEENSENIDLCPFCGESIEDEEYCKKCGQQIKPLSMKSLFKDFLKSMKR
ncbi:GNAT family N-acetyltransferase [Methanobrevibacter sp.]